MKKLMFILAAFALAMGVQAAAIDWKMGTSIKAPNADGSVGTSNAGAGTLSMYVWLVDKATYDAADVSSIADTYSGKLSTATGNVTGKSGSTGGTVTTDGLAFSSTENTPYYAIVLTQYKSGDTEMYLGNKATTSINTAGTKMTVSNLSKNLGGGTGSALTSWSGGSGGSEPVPEPTSGLLLLVGGALLGLRRKRA